MAPPSSQRCSVRKVKCPAVSVLVATSAPPAALPQASQVRMGKRPAVSSRPATSDIGTPTPPPVSAVRLGKRPAVSSRPATSDVGTPTPPSVSAVRLGKHPTVSARPAASDLGTPTPPPPSTVRLGKCPAVEALDGQQRSRKRRALHRAVTSGGEAERASRMSHNATKKQTFEPTIKDS
ncbi:hypothetical protein L873DRAFT_1807820, partial [Choiromyces venosus 120613-1]